MLGDPTKLLNKMRHPSTLARAYDYAVRCRLKNDYYYDYFDIGDPEHAKERVIEELVHELARPEQYVPRKGYAYYPPKTELCYRRMVYIPLKDLVARFAATIVISDLLDDHLSDRAFANRRAKPVATSQSFLESFADKSWPAFANWQEETRYKHKVLLKTDISAFYDSVSHEYLAVELARELHVPVTCEFMVLLKALLRVPVISYNFETRLPKQAAHNEQGLSIGNSTEGVLANMFLKDIDEEMGRIKGISFGRYADDIRIFANTRMAAKHAMLVLQQLLLTRGLNLNSAKTQIAETDEQLEELLSKAYEGYAYGEEAEEEPEEEPAPVGPHAEVVDKPFTAFNKTFPPDFDLAKVDKPEKQAKEFCLFMGKVALLPLASRANGHVDTLVSILKRWQTATKHAAWLLAQTAIHDDVPVGVKEYARAKIVQLLNDVEASSYGKYRLLHHFIKERTRKGVSYFYLEKVDAHTRTGLTNAAWTALAEPAFELNIAAMKLLHAVGEDYSSIHAALKKHEKIPLPLPIKHALDAIARLDDAASTTPPAASTPKAEDDEEEGPEYE